MKFFKHKRNSQDFGSAVTSTSSLSSSFEQIFHLNPANGQKNGSHSTVSIQSLTDNLHSALLTVERNNGCCKDNCCMDGHAASSKTIPVVSKTDEEVGVKEARMNLSKQLQTLKSVLTRLKQAQNDPYKIGSSSDHQMIGGECKTSFLSRRYSRQTSSSSQEAIEIRKVVNSQCRNEPTNNEQQIEFALELLHSHLFFDLLKSITLIDFEDKKIVCWLFKNILQLQASNNRYVIADYIAIEDPDILLTLLYSYQYGQSDITLNCGEMLRDCFTYANLTQQLLENYPDHFYQLFNYVRSPLFDVSMDAFSTMQTALTAHKSIASQFLLTNYRPFFSQVEKLLQSDNYVIKRQSLELLIVLLEENQNSAVREQFTSDVNNLRLVISLMTNNWKQIQFRSLKVFQMFLSKNYCRNMPETISDYLYLTGDKILTTLNVLKQRSANSADFKDHHKLITRLIFDLKQFMLK